MTAQLRPYPAYKETDLPWLDTIPAHWEEKRAKYFFQEVDNRSQTGQEEQLSVSHLTGVTPRSMKNVTMFKAESYVSHKLCSPGDLVINTMWAWMAALGSSRYYGIVSPSYAVYRPSTPDVLLPTYADYLLRSWPYIAEYVTRSTGIRSSRLRLYPEKFLEIPILCPPYEEQRSILSFLAATERSIRRYIRTKRRLIALLNEQKQAIIHQAVTQGLDPDVPRKPSGIEWLGDIPAHWEIFRLKHLISEQLKYGANEAAELTDRSLPRYIRITDIGQDGDLIDSVFRSIPDHLAKVHLLKEGDILLARSGATVGKAFLYLSRYGRAAHAGYLIRARCDKRKVMPK